MSSSSSSSSSGGGGSQQRQSLQYTGLGEAFVYPSTGQPLESKPTAEAWFHDQRWLQLNSDYMAYMLQLFDCDSNIRTVTNIYFATLFAGGVSFERDEAQMKPEAAQWYSMTWSNWGMAVDRLNASIGFAPSTFVPHSEYVGMPVCLDVRRCTILYRRDVYGLPHFVFFENLEKEHDSAFSVAGTGENGGYRKDVYQNWRYVPNVVVYCESEPSLQGEIRSKINSLKLDLELDVALYEAAKVATIGRANPPLVLEAVSEPHDPQSIISALDPLSDSLRLGDGNGPSSSSATSKQAEEQQERNKYAMSQMVGLLGAAGMAKGESLAKMWMRTMSARGVQEHMLPDERKYVKHSLPESPDNLLIAFRTARTERVFNCFGIPLGMMSSTSSFGDSTKTAANDNVYSVFINTQKQKKQQLLAYMYDMYDRIYQLHHVVHRLAKTKLQAKLPNSKFSTETDVHILLTGLPEDSVLDNLYKMGALTYEAFCRFMSNKHSIPIEDFNEECELTLQDINGVKPDAPPGAEGGGAGGGAAKAKSKPKPKK